MTPQYFKLLKEELTTSIRESKIKSVLTKLNTYLSDKKKSDIILISNQLKRLDNDSFRGVATRDTLSAEKNMIVYNLIKFVNELKYEDVSEKLRDVTSKSKSLDILKEKLLAITTTNGIEPVNDLLKKILKASDLRSNINNLEERYSENVWSLHNGKYDLYEEWEIIYKGLAKGVENVINELKIEHLEDNWEIMFSEMDLGITPNNVSILFALFSKIDDIKFPEKVEKEVAVTTSVKKNDEGRIIEETTTELVSDKERRRFKRLMFLYQDTYQMGNYKLAHQYCTQVREEIEPESAHLYQALLLSYFKLNGESDIIKNVINGEKEQEFRNLLVYARRLSSIIQKPLSPKEGNIKKTAKYNIREMLSGLMVKLKDEYSNVKYDYITSPIKKDKDTEIQKRNKVKKCLEIANDITKFMETDAIFTEIMVNELAGGGKFKWLKINAKNELISDSEDTKFNPYTSLRNAQKLIKYYAGINDDNAVKKILVRNLVKSLGTKYRKLSKKKNQEHIGKRLAELIETYKICTILFKNEKAFCDIPIKELSSDDGILDWFELDYDAKLKGRFEPSSVDNFALDMLEYFVKQRDCEANWKPHEDALKWRVYEKLKRKTRNNYDAIEPFAVLPTDKDTDTVKNLIECIENWRKCYDLCKEIPFLEYARDELVGEECMQWFITDDTGLAPNPIFQEVNFPLEEKLQEVTQIINTHTLKENYHVAGKNLFEKIVKDKYDTLKRHLSRYPYQIESKREEIHLCMLITSCLYRSHPLDIYKDTFFEEFICECIVPWFTHQDKRIFANEQSKKLNPVKELNRMVKAIKKKDDEIFYDEILKWVIDNRYKDNLKKYKALNVDYSPDLREDIYNLLNKFKEYYHLTQNPKYLEIPYQEYLSNRWITRLWWRLFFIKARLKQSSNPSYRREYKFLKEHYKPNQKINDKYKLKRPWLTPPPKEPLKLTPGIRSFTRIFNDILGKKKAASANGSPLATQPPPSTPQESL